MTDHAHNGYDVIIVGAGPAGLCAAMYVGRGLLRGLTIERGAPGGELLNTDLIEDYIGFESIKGWELAQKMTEHAKKFGAEIVTDTVERIRKAEDGWFEVATARGQRYRAPAVILTAGGTPVKLGVPGEQEYAGKGVSYCAVCDGAFFKGEVLAVVGGGDAAVEEADYLTRYASKVYIVHRRDQFRASKILQERAFANPKIEVVWNKKVLEIKGTARGTDHLVLEDTVTGGRSTLQVGGVFIFVGFKPNTGLVEGARGGHLKHDAAGYLVTDERMMTSLPGLFAAGDVRSQLTRQITTAVGDATTAAIAVEKYLAAARKKEKAGVAS
jgi:thioredoxin reductase (NADPH)